MHETASDLFHKGAEVGGFRVTKDGTRMVTLFVQEGSFVRRVEKILGAKQPSP